MPAATAPLTVKGHEDRSVTLSTVLPLAWPAMVRADGKVFLGLQVGARSGDASRDLGWALSLALGSTPGAAITPAGLPPADAPRLQDLLADDVLETTLHDGFDYWVDGTPDPDGEVASSLERANASVVPTARLTSVDSAYWCRMKERAHLRWVLPSDEEPTLDALARLAVDGGLAVGAGTRYVGSFRAHGLLCPVWDLPADLPAEALEEPVASLRTRLDEALADASPLPAEARRARAGLLSRQLTLR